MGGVKKNIPIRNRHQFLEVNLIFSNFFTKIFSIFSGEKNHPGMRKFLDLMGPGTLGIDGEALTFKRFHAVVRSGETAMAGDSCLMGCVAVN